MAYIRFKIPEFDRFSLKGMDWQAPEPIGEDEIARLTEAQKAGDASAYGVYPVMPSDALFDHLTIRGDNRHAVMCVMPNSGGQIVGRSYAWRIQRAILTDGLDPSSLNMIGDWITPRPMNTRLGPEDGIEASGIVYALCCNGIGDYWLGNRTILENGDGGSRILSAHIEDSGDFHDCNLEISWSA